MDFFNKKWLAEYFFLAYEFFLLNFLWESWHAVYFYADVGVAHIGDLKGFVFLISYASFVDTLLLLAMAVGGALLWRDWLWWRNMRATKKIGYVVFFCLLLAIIVEYKAVYVFHQWAYNSAMPTVLGLGLSPLLQLPITGLIGFFSRKSL